jgi:hypothetical protein
MPLSTKVQAFTPFAPKVSGFVRRRDSYHFKIPFSLLRRRRRSPTLQRSCAICDICRVTSLRCIRERTRPSRRQGTQKIWLLARLRCEARDRQRLIDRPACSIGPPNRRKRYRIWVRSSSGKLGAGASGGLSSKTPPGISGAAWVTAHASLRLRRQSWGLIGEIGKN